MTDASAPAGLNTEEAVKSYYGKTLKTSSDLKTSACTSQPGQLPKFIRAALSSVHDEVTSRYYGCGPVFPTALKGASVLDLGSGSGQDCYVLSKLVGPEGRVVGLDMTDEQLEVANKYIDYHTKLFNYSTPNVSFVKGYMEKMQEAGLESNQFDIIVSNCVINLSKDKRAVLSEALRVLKVGGELYFSDVYADQDLPPGIREHEELWCECVVGALYWKDLYKLAKEIGFSTPRLVTAGIFDIEDKSYKEFLGDAKFVSVTYRLFKLPETSSEDATVTYNGGIEGFEEEFNFDHGIVFKKGEECNVKAGLVSILTHSRYQKYFTICPGEKKGPGKCSKLQTTDTLGHKVELITPSHLIPFNEPYAQEKDPFEYCAERGNKKGCC